MVMSFALMIYLIVKLAFPLKLQRSLDSAVSHKGTLLKNCDFDNKQFLARKGNKIIKFSVLQSSFDSRGSAITLYFLPTLL